MSQFTQKTFGLILIHSNDRSFFGLKNIIVEYFDRYQKYPNDFKLFDITLPSSSFSSVVLSFFNCNDCKLKNGWNYWCNYI